MNSIFRKLQALSLRTIIRNLGKKLLIDNVQAAAASLLAGLIWVATQFVISRALRPGEFGRAFALVSFYALVARPGASVGRLVAWLTSKEIGHTDKPQGEADAALRAVMVGSLVFGIIIVFISVLLSPILSKYLHVNAAEIVIVAAGLPFGLSIQSLLGSLQGERRFFAWGLLNVLLPLTKLILVILLLPWFGIFGVLLGMSIGTLVNFAMCAMAVRAHLKKPLGLLPIKPPWRTYVPFVSIGMASTFVTGVFLSADVIIVQHYYSHLLAGQYSSVSVIGNTVFSVSGGVVSAMFPAIVMRQSRGERTVSLMKGVILVFASITLLSVAFLQLFGADVIRFTVGGKYLGGAAYLSWYALGMGVLSWTTLMVHSQQARNKYGILYVLIPAMIMRPVLLIWFHSTLLTVVVISDVSVLIYGIVLFGVYMRDELRIGNPPNPTVLIADVS